jgi:hypothetical protein
MLFLFNPLGGLPRPGSEKDKSVYPLLSFEIPGRSSGTLERKEDSVE